ncbi:class I SAM-dependent methyltransferase [Antrihabitans sp. YC2-6]|uniref:class I SAM-dependent methyltransferase n=1 Tax=Antrihabitans sp. YC2-6 TaxID=2799498 RepID=UPI0018F4673F|nr:class I SAM-dependent methyltransferase [Antrihabitans sp. YC2-6]MBJ8348322.1 class I SAM-dependent methyltransferase [Antrihabitans sp. YC2-6]
MSASVKTRSRVSRWLPIVTAAGMVANAVRLRRNAHGLVALQPDQAPVSAKHRFLTAAGVDLDELTRRAASAFARTHALEVVDLVPGDLPTEPALDLLRGLDPRTYRGRRFAPGRGACHALLVDAEVLERAGITQVSDWDPVELAEVTVRLKLYASTTFDVAVAAGLRARDDERSIHAGLRRAAEVRMGSDVLLVAGPPVAYAGLLVGTLLNPLWGAVSLAAFGIQPALVLAGSALHPRDRGASAGFTRVVTRPSKWLRLVTGAQPAPPPDPIEERRPAYAADLAAGIERFFEPRRGTCPWCDSPDVEVRVVSPDHIQHKPGKFVLEQCNRCAHVFQNPRLTPEGLDFYYRDFYDGIGAKLIENTFEAGHSGYAARVAMVTAQTAPRTWLDVGTGLAHFCATARDILPGTEFDGLDRGDNVEEAERRRWVRRGYRGMFPELADDIAGRYDVVSMHHYLEHTRDPFEELSAAAKVLDTGGYLLIEVPDPESPFGRLLGDWWMPWLQPQHQHLIPCDNLVHALADRGLTTVDIHRAEANQAGDLALAILLVVNGFAHDRHLPWLPDTPERAHALRVAGRLAGVALAAPVGGVAMLADLAYGNYIRRTGGVGSIYRVLARKDS